MTRTYEIRLLGTPRLSVDGAEVRVSRRKAMALLAYLAVTGSPHSRDALATLLWPESDPSTARGELRRRLSQVNQLLGGSGLDADRETVRLNPELELWLDVAAFRGQLAGCAAHAHPLTEACPDCVPLLEDAAALYSDHFMAGFTLEDSAAFDDWQFFQAEALRDEVASALVRLATYYTSQGDFERAVDRARRWLAVDPLHEPAHRHLMVLYARSNQRSAALRQYETCRRVLQDELGAEPSERTREVHDRLLSGEMPLAPTAVEAILERELRTVGPCPYRGLAAFGEADAPFYFGREGFINRLERAVTTQPMVAMVVGASGSGKSSVIRAGLLPRLRTAGEWLIVDLRPGKEPFHALAVALCPLVAPDLGGTDRLIETRKLAAALISGSLPLLDVVGVALARRPGPQRLLLLVDQFEELYTLCADVEMRRGFVVALLHAVDAAAGMGILTLLLTLRADFMGQALAYRPFADALQTASQILGPMTREELRSAIEKPAEIQGAAFEAGLTERLLDDVGDEPGNLPLLEFALTLLWERLDFGWLTHAAYEAIGRVEGALARYADEVYEGLPIEEQALCHRVFTQLVQPGEGTEDTRRVASRAEVGDRAWTSIQRLADQRLVVTGRDVVSGAETVEVVHEALISNWGQLQAWMAEDRAFRTWQERLRVALRTWQSTDRDEGALLRGAPLAEAEEWLRTHGENLVDVECAYVEAGVVLRERRAAERAAQRQAELEAARQLAEAHAHALRQAAIGLAAEARNQMGGPNVDVAVLLALEAIEAYPYTWQAERALAQVVLDWRLVKQFPHGAPLVCPASLRPDGTRLLTASNDGVLRVWDLDSGATLLMVQAYEGLAANHIRAAWSPAGERILTVTWEKIPRIWDATTGELLVELGGSSWVDWSPDGTRVVTAGGGRAGATVVDSWTGEVVCSLGSDRGTPDYVSFSPDGEWIATSLGQVWSAENGELVRTLPAYRDQIMRGDQPRFSWSPDGARLGTGMAGTACVWDAATGDEVLILPTRYNGKAHLWWSHDGARLLTTGYTGSGSPAILWDARTGEQLQKLPFYDEVHYLCDPWSPADDGILLADEQGHVTVWETGSGREVLRLTAHRERSRANWLHDGDSFVTAGDDSLARLWRVSTAAFTVGCWPDCPPNTREGFEAPGWSPDGARVARHFADGSVRVWDVATQTEVARTQRRGDSAESAVNHMAWSPDGGRILTGADDGGVDIWDSTSGELLLTLAGHDRMVMSVAWSPDGRRVLSCGRDRRAVVWDAATGEALRVITGQEFFWGAWSPDGQRIVLCDLFSYGGPVRIWDAATGEPMLTLLPDDFRYGTTAVAWSPDGTRIVTFSMDEVGRLWDADSGQLVATFTAGISCALAAWSPLGDRFLAGSYPDVYVWDSATLQEVAAYPSEGAYSYASWAPDGEAIAIGYPNGDLKVYPAWQSLEELVAYAKAHCVLRELTPEERTQFGLPER